MYNLRIKLSDIEVDIEQHTSKYTQLLANIGGISRSIWVFLGWITVLVSRNLFMNSILGELFLVKKHPETTKFTSQKIDKQKLTGS